MGRNDNCRWAVPWGGGKGSVGGEKKPEDEADASPVPKPRPGRPEVRLPMMKLSDLPSEVIERIKSYRYDQILEKHEGPENWASVLRYFEPEFLRLSGYDVLLPVSRRQHPNIQMLRCIVGDGGKTLTLFLRDTTYTSSPQDEMFDAGRIAICDRFEDQGFYLTIVYHEWFIIENP